MSNWTSISVKEAQKDELNEAKDNANHNGSMGEFLVMLKEAYESDHYQQKADGEIGTEAIDDLQDTLESMDIERIGQSMVQVNQLSEEIGRLQDQVNQLEKTLEGLR